AMTLAPATQIGAIGPGPATMSYCETITNTGQFTDSYHFTATSSTGSAIAYYATNPPSSCTLAASPFAIDAQGDGNLTDASDTPPTVANDPNLDKVPDSVTLTAGQTYNFVVQLRPPSSLNNATDTMLVTATSNKQGSTVSAQVTDTTQVGLV